MRSTRHLISIEEAARFAMAPAEDDMAEGAPAPEEALRNGHVEAARRVDPAPAIVGDSRGMWDLFSGWWGGRAHA